MSWREALTHSVAALGLWGWGQTGVDWWQAALLEGGVSWTSPALVEEQREQGQAVGGKWRVMDPGPYGPGQGPFTVGPAVRGGSRASHAAFHVIGI